MREAAKNYVMGGKDRVMNWSNGVALRLRQILPITHCALIRREVFLRNLFPANQWVIGDGQCAM
jgi:hypothetical protein